MNFLDHLDEWIEQAMDRASSVVAAKVICFLFISGCILPWFDK